MYNVHDMKRKFDKLVMAFVTAAAVGITSIPFFTILTPRIETLCSDNAVGSGGDGRCIATMKVFTAGIGPKSQERVLIPIGW